MTWSAQANKTNPVAAWQDMINNVGHRARSNAIAQHKLKMQLVSETLNNEP
jgi:hypothetical protein